MDTTPGYTTGPVESGGWAVCRHRGNGPGGHVATYLEKADAESVAQFLNDMVDKERVR